MKRIIKFRAYTEISNEVLGMKYDVPHNYNDTVMQFTGLLDRHGKEIYEGDIWKEGTDIGEVKWNEKGACFEITDGEDSIKDLVFVHNGEIVGNIYDNPELLTN